MNLRFIIGFVFLSFNMILMCIKLFSCRKLLVNVIEESHDLRLEKFVLQMLASMCNTLQTVSMRENTFKEQLIFKDRERQALFTMLVVSSMSLPRMSKLIC